MYTRFKNILLIDDDEINNTINRMIIKWADFAEQTVICTSGREALNYVKKNCLEQGDCPQIVFLDINMPAMNGFQFLEELNKTSSQFMKKVPVVMLSSSKNEKDVEMANNYNVAGFVNKPLTPEKLEAIASSIPKK
jgi:CheY-like chemotaxis protein